MSLTERTPRAVRPSSIFMRIASHWPLTQLSFSARSVRLEVSSWQSLPSWSNRWWRCCSTRSARRQAACSLVGERRARAFGGEPLVEPGQLGAELAVGVVLLRQRLLQGAGQAVRDADPGRVAARRGGRDGRRLGGVVGGAAGSGSTGPVAARPVRPRRRRRRCPSC